MNFSKLTENSTIVLSKSKLNLNKQDTIGCYKNVYLQNKCVIYELPTHGA